MEETGESVLDTDTESASEVVDLCSRARETEQSTMDRLFGRRKSPEEMLRQNQRALNKVRTECSGGKKAGGGGGGGGGRGSVCESTKVDGPE